MVNTVINRTIKKNEILNHFNKEVFICLIYDAYVIDQSKDDNKEERKRKRRSRWGDVNTKVVVTETNISSGNKSTGTMLPQPGIAIPGQIGQAAVIIPPSSKGQMKSTKNPMLTKISRNDPALIHYARQTFGTLELSEEQWKKAEDHYKVDYCHVDRCTYLLNFTYLLLIDSKII